MMLVILSMLGLLYVTEEIQDHSVGGGAVDVQIRCVKQKRVFELDGEAVGYEKEKDEKNNQEAGGKE